MVKLSEVQKSARKLLSKTHIDISQKNKRVIPKFSATIIVIVFILCARASARQANLAFTSLLAKYGSNAQK